MNLKKTVTSGHLFAYDELNDGFQIVNGNTSFFVKQKNNKLSFSGITEDRLHAFFDHDKKLNLPKELEQHAEIKLVRQDLRQAILTFIMTANNNQKRIKKMMDSFRDLHPKRHIPTTFSEEQLRNIGFGYRAKNVAATNKILTKKFLDKIKKSDYEEQRNLLLTLPGVGPKVADCIMAYSELACPYAFPQDVWVIRAVKRRHKLKSYSYDYVRRFAKKKFGKDASYVQHYYFLEEQKVNHL